MLTAGDDIALLPEWEELGVRLALEGSNRRTATVLYILDAGLGFSRQGFSRTRADAGVVPERLDKGD